MSNIMQKQAYTPSLVEDMQRESRLLRHKARCAVLLNNWNAAVRYQDRAQTLEMNADVLRRGLNRAGAQ
jgi:hypothetical protein